MPNGSVIDTHVYDTFDGPDVDGTRWMALPVQLPDGGVRPAVEPSAVTVVGDGSLDITVERFENSHDSVQSADNAKHMVVSTQQFTLPRRGTASFAIDQAVTRLGRRVPDDVMLALAAFNVIDFERGMVFDILSNGHEVFAVHEQLPGAINPAGPPFTHVVRQPFAPVEVSPGVAHHCEIRIDTGAATVHWLVDGTEIYHVAGVTLPERVGFGLALMSGVLLRDGRSSSLRGQGLRASWSTPSVTMTGA